MATIINNPSDSNNAGSGAGLIIGIVIAIIVLFIFIVYALPALRGSRSAGTTVNVPDKINVNVNKGTY
jgi:hypothetical protein